MFVHFTIYNTSHNLPRKSYNVPMKIIFFFFMGVQNAKENVFHGFVTLATWFCQRFGKVLEIFSEELVLTLFHYTCFHYRIPRL